MLHIKSLAKSFNSNQVLKDVSISFLPGHIYGIAGKNGAGKTTLFNCINGHMSYEGSIDLEPKENSKRIAYLMTNPPMLSYITGREYLQLICNARNKTDINFDQINIFNLPLEEYAEQYSTGMTKKLALTGILLQDNEIFILDEPYNGLDLESVTLVKEIIQNLKNRSKTIIISSHMLEGLFALCDHFCLLENGTLRTVSQQEEFNQISKNMLNDDFITKLDSILDGLKFNNQKLI